MLKILELFIFHLALFLNKQPRSFYFPLVATLIHKYCESVGEMYTKSTCKESELVRETETLQEHNCNWVDRRLR